MSPDPATPAEERITLDDIKHRAEAVKDLAVVDARDAIGKVVSDDSVKTLLYMAGAVVVVASVAFFLGASVRRDSRPPAPPVV